MGIIMKLARTQFWCLVSLTLLSQCVTAWSSSAISLFEGKIPTSTAHGFVDVRLNIWNKGDTEKSKLIQSIVVPRVQVKDGSFTIFLDAGLDNKIEKNLDVKIESRLFESGSTFEPAELSRFVFHFNKKFNQSGNVQVMECGNSTLVLSSKP